MKSTSFEVNFDGLVGPTHNYSGLSHGNIASTSHRALASNPRAAVLQGLSKMKKLLDLGMKQAVIPPQERPFLPALKALGYQGKDAAILEKVAKESPDILSAIYSASSMWTANAATVSPRADTADGKTHFTPANLNSKFHRSIEPGTTSHILKKIFKSSKHFTHHEALFSVPAFGDEGAANHTRLCSEYGKKGVEFFVYGRGGVRGDCVEPSRFPARQSREASMAIARLHGLNSAATVFAQQNPEAVDAGVFHNDVVGVGNRGVYFYHQQAYVNSAAVMTELRKKYFEVCGGELTLIEVPTALVSLQDAVQSYLFNSQILSLPNGKTAIVLPEESKINSAVSAYIRKLLGDHGDVISEALYFDLKQSMSNGGGPACLRLRVVMSTEEIKAAHQGIFLTDALYKKLVSWAEKHYREELYPKDLADPSLLKESRAALDDLTKILKLGSLYDFQK